MGALLFPLMDRKRFITAFVRRRSKPLILCAECHYQVVKCWSQVMNLESCKQNRQEILCLTLACQKHPAALNFTGISASPRNYSPLSKFVTCAFCKDDRTTPSDRNKYKLVKWVNSSIQRNLRALSFACFGA